MRESWSQIKERVDTDGLQKDIDDLIKRFRDKDPEIGRQLIHDKIKRRDFSRSEGKRLVGSFRPDEFLQGVEYLWQGNLIDFSLFHMERHGAYKKIMVGEFDTLLPNDKQQWKTCHNARHHRYTNFVEIDADYKIFNKFIRAHRDIKWRPAHRFQLLELALSVTFFRASFPLHYSNVPDHGFKPEDVTDPLTYITGDIEDRSLLEDIKTATSGVPGWFETEYLVPLKNSGFRFINTALGLMIADLITNLFQYVILAPAHHHDDVLHFQNDEKPDGRGEWYLMQLLTGCSFSDCAGFFSEMVPDFVFHISHHLFPATPECFYEEMGEETRQICAKYDVPYYEKELRKEALNHFKNLFLYTLPIDNQEVSRRSM